MSDQPRTARVVVPRIRRPELPPLSRRPDPMYWPNVWTRVYSPAKPGSKEDHMAIGRFKLRNAYRKFPDGWAVEITLNVRTVSRKFVKGALAAQYVALLALKAECETALPIIEQQLERCDRIAERRMQDAVDQAADSAGLGVKS